jgi:hypothetical protein
VDAARLEAGCFDDDACTLVDYLDGWIGHFSKILPDAATLLDGAHEAVPDVEGFRLAVQTTWHAANQDGSASKRQRLVAAYLCDQAYMIAITGWNYKDRVMPQLSEARRNLFEFALQMEMRRQMRIHRQYVQTFVVTEGWPRRSEIGDEGEQGLWLIAQHADADPAFQYHMLRMMEPRVESGDIDAKERAYLYDRIMLKLTGEQRYGTQNLCRDGHHVTAPLEEAGRKVDEHRRQAHMGPLDEYVKQFPGSC